MPLKLVVGPHGVRLPASPRSMVSLLMCVVQASGLLPPYTILGDTPKLLGSRGDTTMELQKDEDVASLFGEEGVMATVTIANAVLKDDVAESADALAHRLERVRLEQLEKQQQETHVKALETRVQGLERALSSRMDAMQSAITQRMDLDTTLLPWAKGERFFFHQTGAEVELTEQGKVATFKHWAGNNCIRGNLTSYDYKVNPDRWNCFNPSHVIGTRMFARGRGYNRATWRLRVEKLPTHGILPDFFVGIRNATSPAPADKSVPEVNQAGVVGTYGWWSGKGEVVVNGQTKPGHGGYEVGRANFLGFMDLDILVTLNVATGVLTLRRDGFTAVFPIQDIPMEEGKQYKLCVDMRRTCCGANRDTTLSLRLVECIVDLLG